MKKRQVDTMTMIRTINVYTYDRQIKYATN